MEFTDLVDLASEKLGGAVLFANDEFFAPKENLLKPTAAIWKEGKYTDRGKWMDGWETMRRRSPGWMKSSTGASFGSEPRRIRGVTVDTAFFRGNFPSHCSIDACSADSLDEKTDGRRSSRRSRLRGIRKTTFAIDSANRATMFG
jgi:allantoicase